MTRSRSSRTGGTLLLGALAGIVGTAAMTAAMRGLHRHLPPPERYPLPPREIIEGTLPDGVLRDGERQDLTQAGHFAYGAGTTAITLRELERAEVEVFANRIAPDRPHGEPARHA